MPSANGETFQPTKRPRWSISAIFVITTVVAAAIPGAKSAGLMGALTSIFFFWMAMIGAACIYVGIRQQRGRALTVFLGLYFIGIGIMGFCSITAMSSIIR